jgi:hypothetical protein
MRLTNLLELCIAYYDKKLITQQLRSVVNWGRFNRRANNEKLTMGMVMSDVGIRFGCEMLRSAFRN